MDTTPLRSMGWPLIIGDAAFPSQMEEGRGKKQNRKETDREVLYREIERESEQEGWQERDGACEQNMWKKYPSL